MALLFKYNCYSCIFLSLLSLIFDKGFDWLWKKEGSDLNIFLSSSHFNNSRKIRNFRIGDNFRTSSFGNGARAHCAVFRRVHVIVRANVE